MTKSTRLWLLAGILLIAIFLRFYHFTTTPPGLYPDEAADGNNAVETAETNHFQPFYVENNGREGLYINIIAVFLKVWPIYEPWVVRLPAAVAGALTVLAMYFLASELFGYGTGLLSAFLLATSFWHINFSRIGFRAILAPLLLAWALYFLTKAFKAASERLASTYSIIAGVFYGLGFYTYIAYRITPLVFLLFIPFFRKQYPEFWKRTLIFAIAVLLVAAPLGWYFLKHPSDFFGRISEITVANSENPIKHFAVNLARTALMFNFRGDYNWRHNLSGAPELWWPVGILFLLGMVLGLFYLWKSWRAKTLLDDSKDELSTFALFLIFLWIILALLPAAASDQAIPHALRSILALPPAMIFAAIGGMWCYRWMKNRWNKTLAKTIAVIFIAAVAVYGYVDYFVVWAQNPAVALYFNADYVELSAQINALPQATPKYIVVAPARVIDRGIPMTAHTVMFLTHSFTIPDRTAQNIIYLLPRQEDQIPPGTPSGSVFYMAK